VIDPQPSPTLEPAPPTPATEAAVEHPPLVLLAADDALVCVDEMCLPPEATR
jgi:hypothetical protein